jgi:hypothetical protein
MYPWCIHHCPFIALMKLLLLTKPLGCEGPEKMSSFLLFAYNYLLHYADNLKMNPSVGSGREWCYYDIAA